MSWFRAVLLILVSFLANTLSQNHAEGRMESYDQDQKQSKCGYESCPIPKDNMLNIHLVPHSHDDVGWLKTVDQYYYGSKGRRHKAGVQYILDSVVEALRKNPDRKFIYVESAFFFKWWDEQTPEVKEAVHELVREGRLEFVGGAWSMNDEAAVHYQSVIDQFTWGLRLLNDTFGKCGRPRAGWQIDPFGHSREQTSMFAQMGYDGLFFGRLDWRDKFIRMNERTAEMVWESSANLPDRDLFTSVLYNLYMCPPGFCFDAECFDEPIIDGLNSVENNVKERVNGFVNYVNKMSTSYRSNNLLITMGGDFHFSNANVNFKNLDKLIKYTNELQRSNGSKINVFYSTPTCYLKAVHDAQLIWPSKTNDFFPLASDPHTYWTGYYTSRPTSKRYERHANHFLQVCKQLTALSPCTDGEKHLTYLREAVGVMQHHDAITGTEQQHVADDYSRMLHVAIESSAKSAKASLHNLMSKNTRIAPMKFESCHLLNISQCVLSETKDNFVVTLYNPLAQTSNQYVRLPVTGHCYVVRDHTEQELLSQIVSIPEPISTLTERTASSSHELIFRANDIPPVGYRSYFISKSNTCDHLENGETPSMNQTVSIGNDHLALTFDEQGFLSMITIDGERYRLQQNFLYYEGATGNNHIFKNRSSGAYIFRPGSPDKRTTSSAKLTVIKGSHVQEVHQKFTEWISQVIRVYRDERHVEFEWMVGPIPIDDGKGKEVITKYSTDIQSNKTFWTDSNGREMIKRIRNHRDTWYLKLMEPIAGNYYPVTTKIALEDNSLRMAVLNDRSQGGTSMEDGTIELMLHRRLLHDDDFGVWEALNETAYGEGLVARGKHYLVFDMKNQQTNFKRVSERILQNHVMMPAWIFLSDATDLSLEEWKSNFTNLFSALSASLPKNVNLLTFEPWKKPSNYLVRFEHLFEKDDDLQYSTTVSFNLNDIFSKFNIISVRETNLAANQWIEDSSRLKFSKEGETISDPATTEQSTHKISDILEVILNSMEIRTFVIQMNSK